ncbi:hypothetical protein [Lignipirellula cremea]|uniref:hypothetical protein n=1 Tax=Lignipirellula cremea TaxID=2528010 RepID=UPI0011A30372|nr:hypothetical protein [Lignipirellula cremea]
MAITYCASIFLAVALLLWVGNRFVAKPWKPTAIGLLVLGGIVGLCVLPGFLVPLLYSAGLQREIDIAPQENGTVQELRLNPDTISGFCDESSLKSVSPQLEFAMSESAFLAWAQTNAWQPQRFTAVAPGLVELSKPNRQPGYPSHVEPQVYSVRTRQHFYVRRGYLVCTMKSGLFVEIIFDIETSKCYVAYLSI